MSIFDMNEDRLRGALYDAYIRSNYDLDKAEADSDFQLAMEMYVNQHEGKNFDDALIIAENGYLHVEAKQGIVDMAERLPDQTVQEDPNILMYYDISLSRV